MRELFVLLSGVLVISACVQAEPPPISGVPLASAGASGSGGSGAVSGGDGAADSPTEGSAGTGGGGGSSAGTAGVSGSGGAAGSGGTAPCEGERFITPCNGTTATRCIDGVAEQVQCSACSKLSCTAPTCCGDVHPYVLDPGFVSHRDNFSNFNQSAASVDFEFEGDDWQGAIGWFFNPTAGSISAINVQASVSGPNVEPPFVTLEREGAGCEYMLDGSGNADFPGTNCWGGFNPNDVAWLAVRTRSTAAGRATLTVTSINITP